MSKCKNDLCLSLATKGVYLIQNSGRDLVSSSGCPTVKFSLTAPGDTWASYFLNFQLTGNIEVYIDGILVQVLPYLEIFQGKDQQALNCDINSNLIKCTPGYYVPRSGGIRQRIYITMILPFGSHCSFSIMLSYQEYQNELVMLSVAISDISLLDDCQNRPWFGG